MHDRLKPCPFCGSECDMEGTEDFGWYVLCPACSSMGPVYRLASAAALQWNGRSKGPSKMMDWIFFSPRWTGIEVVLISSSSMAIVVSEWWKAALFLGATMVSVAWRSRFDR